MPDVSVIVPAHDAAATIGRTLEALGRQEFGGSFEVVVVDDRSTDATAAIATRAGARVVPTAAQSGPAGARNAGIAATDAPLVAFTDADCEPAPGWLAGLAAGLGGADLVLGPVLPDPRVEVGPFDRTLRLVAQSPRFETANMGVRREMLERVGGFEPFAPDPAAPRPGLRPRPDQGHFGEDAVFGWRAVRAGARTTFCEAALVHHAVFPRGPRGYMAEKWRLRYFPALVREIPEIRETLPLGVFLSQRTALFDLAAAGAVATAATRRPWPLAAAIPYVSRSLRTRDPWRRSVWRHNLAVVCGDAIGLAALLRGSAAARRLLL
nr:hypothetical protein [uncultured bacterium]